VQRIHREEATMTRHRFRGATVENPVQFERRCEAHLGVCPQRVDLSMITGPTLPLRKISTGTLKRSDSVLSLQ
jgi:hypothetical protein